MVSFLDGMAGSIYAGFKGKLHQGVIRRLGDAPGLDGHGRPQDRPPILHTCEGFEDNYSEFTRAQAGIPRSSVRVNIFAASIKPPLARPLKDMMVRLDTPAGAIWYQLQERITTDPARALWQCEAQFAKPPA